MTDQSIRSFLDALAIVRELFRSAAIELEKSGKLKDIQISVSPFRTSKNTSLTISLDADFALHHRSGAPIGISVKLESVGTKWLLEEYIHFPDGDLDWFDYEEREYELKSASKLLALLPCFARQALATYKKAIESA